MDSLQWEIHRLEVENRHLPEENPEVSGTLEQLEGAKREVAELTDRTSELERRLTETARAAEDAAERAQRAETRAEELETRRLGEETDGHGGEAEASLEIERLRADHERSLREVQQELAEQGTRLGEEERWNRAAREDLLQRAELERYRALDEQRQKWEARETRLIARLEAVEEELGALGDSTSRAADNEHLKEQLRSLASDLQAVQSLVSSLTEQNHELARENKRLDLENRQVQESPGLAGCRQNQGEPVLSGGMDGVCESHTRHATSGIRREQEEQQESCARRDLVTGGPSDSVLVPPCESLEISWRESRAGLESQAAPRSEALAVPVVGNDDGGRRSWEQDGDSAYRTENQQGSELTGTRSAGYATIVRTTPARGSSGSNTQTTFSSERPRPVTFARPPSRPTDRDPSATFTMVSEGFSNGMGVTPVCLGGESVQQPPEHMPLPSGRGDLGASMHYQPQLGNVQPWPPPGGAELMGRVNTVPCLGTGERSDQWGGEEIGVNRTM